MGLKNPKLKEFIEAQITKFEYSSAKHFEFIENSNMKMMRGNPFDKDTKMVELNNPAKTFVSLKTKKRQSLEEFNEVKRYLDWVIIARKPINSKSYVLEVIEPSYLKKMEELGRVNVIK